jgi:glycosyltransferase involved in cell wall biosynthesis
MRKSLVAFACLLIRLSQTVPVPVHVACEADLDLCTSTEVRVAQAFADLQPNATVSVRRKNRLNGMWTVVAEPSSNVELTAPSLFFAASDDRFAVRRVVLPRDPIAQRTVGCTAIVQTYDRERYGAAIALVRRLSAFAAVAAVVLVNNRFDDDFNASRLVAKHAPILLLQNRRVAGAASVANRWWLPESAVGTHCAVVLDDDILPTPEAVECMTRRAIDAHAANSAVAQIGIIAAAHLAENNTYSRPAHAEPAFRYNMVLSGQSTFARFGCVREWFAAAPPAAHDIVAHQAAHCDDVLVTLLLAQHGVHGVRLGGASAYGVTLSSERGMSRMASNGSILSFAQRIEQRSECLALLRQAIGIASLPPADNTVLPCAAMPATRVVNVAVTVNEYFNRSYSDYGGYAQAASMYIGANFANPTFADFGASGRVAVTFVCCSKLLNQPTHDHTHPVVFVQQFVADVRKGVRQRPDLVLTIDFDKTYMALLDVFVDVPVLLWSRNPTPDTIKQYRATLRLPTLPDTTIKAAVEAIPSPRALLRRIVAEKRVVFVASLDRLMADRIDAYVESDADVEATLSATAVGTLCNPLETTTCNSAWKAQSDEFWRHSSKSAPLRVRVVILGRIDPIKRPWVALEIASRFPQIDFTFAGDLFLKFANGTPFAQVYDTYVWQRMHTLPNVRWIPFVDVETRTRLLCSADALMSTSITEGIPLSVLEAMAAGVVVISQTNTANVTSRFGRLVLGAGGDGLDESSLASYGRVLQEMYNAKVKARARLAVARSYQFDALRRQQARHFVQNQMSRTLFRRQLVSIFGLLLW